MGGDLTMTSTLGEGSTFTLCLPAPQGDETAEQRRARAAPASFAASVRGLSQIGEALRDEVHRVIGSYSSRLRSDPATPLAATLRQPDLEDHAVTFLADIAQSLIMLDEAEQHAVDLLEDSTEIQQTIAMRHGRRRQRQGWSEASVARDFAILRDEAERVIRERVTASSEDLEQAFVVVQRLIERAEGISLRAWREAGRRSDWRD